MLKGNALHCAQKLLGLDKEITNLKLQKLLYYAQGWHLALVGPPLFTDEIEAWVHGPVVRSVFTQFKHGELAGIPLDESTDRHLFEVFEVFGKYTGYQLERMTHNEKPWLDARKGLPPDVPSRNVISRDAMKSFFKAQMDG